MVATQRAVDRGNTRGRRAIRTVGDEVRRSRLELGLSLRGVAAECNVSQSELSRIERGMADWVSVVLMSRVCAVVGLDLSVRAYPGGRPLRDARHGRVLEKLHSMLNPSLGWALEVPLPNPGDQRAWDALIKGRDWRVGVECELNPFDGQALLRRLHLKQRDGAVDAVLLLMPDTRQTRIFRRQLASALREEFGVSSSVALKRLAAGLSPGGSSVVVV